MGGVDKQSMHKNEATKKRTQQHNFKHQQAQAYVDTFSQMFRSPDVYAAVPGGIAIWYPKRTDMIEIGGKSLQNIFVEHWCRDEYIKHLKPKLHYDFFYSFISIDLNKRRWSDVLSVSGSVSYDPLKKQLYARCGSVEANIATLYTCMLINFGKVSIEDVQQNSLYKANIVKTSNPDDVVDMYTSLAKMLPQKVIRTGYWSIAFPSEGGKED